MDGECEDTICSPSASKNASNSRAKSDQRHTEAFQEVKRGRTNDFRDDAALQPVSPKGIDIFEPQRQNNSQFMSSLTSPARQAT